MENKPKLKNIDYYRPHLDEIIARYQTLYAAQGPGHLCLFIDVPYQGEALESMPLTKIDAESEDGFVHYFDMTLRNLERVWRANRDISDDNIPTAYINLGIGDYNAFVAGEIIFQQDTSMTPPVIRAYSDLEELTMDDHNHWLQVLEFSIRYLVSYCDPAGIPIARGHFSPLDLAQALRGEVLFADFFENPDWVHQLMRFCVRATIWLEERIQKIIGEWRGGRVAGAWLPARTICMSEDVACMVSPKSYAQFGRPYTQQVIDHFGHGQIHTHSLGFHVIPEMAQLKNLIGIQITQDPNTDRTFEHLDDLLGRCAKVPLSVNCSYNELIDCIDDLSQRTNIILCPSVKDHEQAREAIELVRSHSRI
jgi:hypothetical protein